MAVILYESTVNPDLLATDIAAQVIAVTVQGVEDWADLHLLPGLRLCRANAARFAWQFVRDEIAYIAEEGDQFVRRPLRTMADGRADCKSTAAFIGSFAAAHGCAVDLVFVRHLGTDHLGHVYAVCDGIAADPLEQFGTHPNGAERISVTITHGHGTRGNCPRC